jgi:hypothetical protein
MTRWRGRREPAGPETHGAAVPLQVPGPPLAVNARTARFGMDYCPRCARPVDVGDRVADLPAGGGTVHAACAARQPPARPSAPGARRRVNHIRNDPPKGPITP